MSREIASALAAHVRFSAARNHEPPTLLLASSDEVVRRLGRGERGAIASMLVLLVDATRHTVRIANAGMPAPVVGGRAGLCVPLGDRGPALGLVTGMQRSETGPIRLSPGQILVAATDGVIDAASADGSTFGADRLAEIITDRRAEGPAAVARDVIRRTDEWTSPEDADDRTVFAMRLA
jgi:serine phosphatase RsbU (regulator of sigma subunit)